MLEVILLNTVFCVHGMAVKPLLNVQCPPMSLEKVWQAILRQFWRYVRPRVNPKDGFDFNEILWSFLDQSRRWGQELQM